MNSVKMILKAFPIDFMKIDSRKTLPRLISSLNYNIDKKQEKVDYVSSNEFVGKVFENGFTIRKKIYSVNSFVPILHGRFKESSNGIHVQIFLCPHILVSVSMMFLFPFFFIIFAGQFREGQLELNEPLLLLFIYIIITASFRFEAAKAKRAVMRILK